MHVATGSVLGARGGSAMGALALSVFWEMSEQPMKRRLPALFPIPQEDTRLNSFFDTVGWMGGWYVANRIHRQVPLLQLGTEKPGIW